MSLKAIIKFVITVELSIFYKADIDVIFRFYKYYIASYSKYYNSKFNKECNKSTKVYFQPAVWLSLSLTSVKTLGFGFMILCSLRNYFPVFYWTLLHIKIQKHVYLLYIYYVCQCDPYFDIFEVSIPKFWLKISSVMSILLYTKQSRISNK